MHSCICHSLLSKEKYPKGRTIKGLTGGGEWPGSMGLGSGKEKEDKGHEGLEKRHVDRPMEVGMKHEDLFTTYQ